MYINIIIYESFLSFVHKLDKFSLALYYPT